MADDDVLQFKIKWMVQQKPRAEESNSLGNADILLNKIKKWVGLQKHCARKFNDLADELEETIKGANVTKVVGSSVSVAGAAAMTGAGLLTFMTGGVALPVLAAVAAGGALASGTSLVTSVGSEVVVAKKSKDAMNEAKKIIEELQELEKEIQDLMKPLKPGAGGEPSGSRDDDANVMEQLLRSEAKRQGLDLSHSVNLRRICGLPKANISRKIMANNILLAGTLTVLLQILTLAAKEGGKKAAKFVGKRVASKAAGCVAGGAAGLLFSVPELVSDCENLKNCETEASKTLRKNAKAVQTAAEEMEKELQIIREALKKLVRIKFIIKKKNRSSEEKKELLEFVKKKLQDEFGREWLEENQNSEKFLVFLDLCIIIYEKIDEEEKKKKDEEKDEEKTKIDLIFVAHGGITNEVIPARSLLPLPSIIDVILYSPWNCLLGADAAYGIATGRIKPHHRRFVCRYPGKCPLPDSLHVPLSLPDNWNSMSNAGILSVPIIMVSPVGKMEDPAFSALLLLEAMFGQPGGGRYVIPFLAPWTESIPFSTVVWALSLVLLFTEYEATVHLAACLNKTPEDTILNETDLMQQYCYSVDHTVMGVTQDSIHIPNPLLFNMMKDVFG